MYMYIYIYICICMYIYTYIFVVFFTNKMSWDSIDSRRRIELLLINECFIYSVDMTLSHMNSCILMTIVLVKI